MSEPQTKPCLACKNAGFDEQIFIARNQANDGWVFTEPDGKGGKKDHEHKKKPGGGGAGRSYEKKGWDIEGSRDKDGNITMKISFRVYEKDKVIDELKSILHALKTAGELAEKS